MNSLTVASSSHVNQLSQQVKAEVWHASGRELVLSFWSWNKLMPYTGNTYKGTFFHSHRLLKFIHILERGQISYNLDKVVLKARSVSWSGSRHSHTNIVLAQQMSGGRWGNRHASCCIAIKNNLPWSHSLHIQKIYKWIQDEVIWKIYKHPTDIKKTQKFSNIFHFL